MRPLRVLGVLGAVLCLVVTAAVAGMAGIVGIAAGRSPPGTLSGAVVSPALGSGAALATGAAAGASGEGGGPSPAAAIAVSWALAHLGAPYRWGATGPGAFDCSGLTQAAYAAAGVRIPRVAQDQYDSGPRLAPGASLVPGDLVFFGTSARAVTHVGMAVGGGDMVDAPHTGAQVRVEPIRAASVLGETRPAP